MKILDRRKFGVDSSDGCTRLWMKLILLNYTLKNVWKGAFYVYFTTSLENEHATIFLKNCKSKTSGDNAY